jgi:tol-pal system protein YbgF
MNGKAFRAAAAPGMAAAMALAMASTALAEKPPLDPVEKRFQSIEKQLKQLREIVLQAKDTGQPVQVRITTEPDPTLDALSQKVDDLEQAARTRNDQIDTLSHDLESARKADADDREKIKALEDRLTGLEARLKAVDDAQRAAAAQAAQAAQTAVQAPPAAAPPGPPPSDADAEGAFKHANQLMREGDYAGAADAFTSFIQTYGETTYGPEASYRLGQILFVQSRYTDAAAAYIVAIRGYPPSPWAPSAMIDLAKTFIALKRPTDACHTVDEMGRRYPGAPPAAKAKARDIRAAAKCGA